MIKNYFKIAFANLMKSRVYSSISISSLSVGLAVVILLFLYVSNELSYDRYHEKSDNIYRLCQEAHPYQAPGAAKLLTEKLPEIKSYARILPRDNILVQFDEQKYKEDLVAWVDAELFEIFSFEFINGNPETSLQQPGTAVLTESTARKYFGNENAIGKTFKVSGEYDYTVVGVIKNIPQNSHFTFDIFLTLADGNKMYGENWMDSWGWNNFLVYFEMQDQFSKPDLEAKISELLKDYNNADGIPEQYTVQNLKDIHLYSSHFLGDIQPQNSITYVLIFSAIALLILLIASFNYVNLLTANATTRVTEIGVRKTFGATRKQLAMQFISESIIVFFISFLISLIIVWLSLPIFNELSGKALSFSILINPEIMLMLVAVMLLVGILAGWYPAFVLSSYSPTKVMKSSNSGISSKFQIKKILVGAQFTIVIVLIASATVMLRQISFLQDKDLGFDKEAVLHTIFDFGDEAKYNNLKQTLLNETFVSSVSTASRIPSGSLSNQGYVRTEGQEEAILIPYVHVNFDYFRTLGIKPIQGRLFSDQFKTDAVESVILNKAAVALIGLEGDPIGQTIRCNWPKSNRKIVGIIDNINFESLYNKVKPAVFVIYYPLAYHIIVKVKPSNLISSKNSITEICQSIYPNEVIEFSFLDAQLEQRYQKDYNTFQLMGYFAVLAIILASMGLLGMASFIITGRTKEIGLRKVNGATVSEIMTMLNISFVKWMGISFVIATPIAYYSMNKWLENFAYKASLSWWIFALAGIISLVIVLLTVSGLSYRAARRNPVEALRYE
ncbi:MAG: ABC transporter permease [Bacteroidales bacterium]|nr:ABC transporter permease [Bacteroidales bacterium]